MPNSLLAFVPSGMPRFWPLCLLACLAPDLWDFSGLLALRVFWPLLALRSFWPLLALHFFRPLLTFFLRRSASLSLLAILGLAVSLAMLGLAVSSRSTRSHRFKIRESALVFEQIHP
jgi:hypothetical protein